MHNSMKKFHRKFKESFTIIEIVISIFILSFALVGVFNAFSIIVILASNSQDRFIASYLLQEGMEIVRNIRDTNWLAMDKANCISGQDPDCPVSWLDGLALTARNNLKDCSASGLGCEADYTYTYMYPYSSLDYFKIDENGFYNYKNGTNTKFQRKVIITPMEDVDGDSNHIIKVVVQVSWDQKATLLSPGQDATKCCPISTGCPSNVSNCIVAEETLYDWYNYKNH